MQMRSQAANDLALLACLGRVLRDRRGVTAMEYAALALGTVIATAVAAEAVGVQLTSIFNAILPHIG